VLYSVQETCTRKILYKKPCQTVKFLVQVDLYKFLVQVSWLCVITITPLQRNVNTTSVGLAVLTLLNFGPGQMNYSNAQARGNYFLTGERGVKITRTTFWEVHESVINDNKNTVLDLVSEYNIIMTFIPRGCVLYYQKIFLAKKSGGPKYHAWPPGKFPGVIWPPWPPGSRAPGNVWM